MSAISVKSVPDAATVTLENNTPPDWGAVVVRAGCQFVYKDGTSYLDGPKDVYVPSGQSITLRADQKKCVKVHRLGAVVRVPNQNDQPVGIEQTAPD